MTASLAAAGTREDGKRGDRHWFGYALRAIATGEMKTCNEAAVLGTLSGAEPDVARLVLVLVLWEAEATETRPDRPRPDRLGCEVVPVPVLASFHGPCQQPFGSLPAGLAGSIQSTVISSSNCGMAHP